MNRARRIIATLLMLALAGINISAQTTPRRRTPSTAGTNRQTQPASRAASTSNRTAPAASTRAASATDARLTGVYRLDVASSDDPRAAAERATGNQPFGADPRTIDDLMSRLTSPDKLTLERRGQTVSIASTRAPRITFEADGRENEERAEDGHSVRTRAVLYPNSLMVTSTGSRDDEFSVNFDSIDEGRRLRVTRRITSEQFDKPVIVQSIYDKISSVARFNIYGEPEAPRNPATIARNTPRTYPNNARNAPPVSSARNNRPQVSPPVITQRPPQTSRPASTPNNDAAYVFVVPQGTQFIATLDNDLTTAQSREGDRFTMTVRSPAQYAGAQIEGTVTRVSRGGRINGRSELTLGFQQIRLRDGRTAGFNGTIESVRATGNEQARVASESTSNIQDKDNQGDRAVQRAAIGAAVGAIIGAIAGGGKGAAIGAVAGAGAGAGSVYAQGRDDLELRSGTEITIRSSTPRGQNFH